MARNEGQPKRARSGLITIILGLCIVYFMFSLISSQLELAHQREQLQKVQVQVEELRIENKDTERLISMNEDDKYIERIAKDKLKYAFPDERIFIDISGTK